MYSMKVKMVILHSLFAANVLILDGGFTSRSRKSCNNKTLYLIIIFMFSIVVTLLRMISYEYMIQVSDSVEFTLVS